MSLDASMWNKPDTWVEPSQGETALVIELLGKVPQGEFCIVARDDQGNPTVIENAPFFDDGTPMPTRYWLIDKELVADVSRVESMGGVKLAQEEIDPEIIKEIHNDYEKKRDALICPTYDGPRPSGGVGGTRRGLKCLHTHVANLLGSGDDAVGSWTLNKIAEMKSTPVIQGATPVIQGATPVIQGSTPVIQGATPVIQGATPVIQNEVKDLI